MTPREFYQQISEVDERTRITLAPGPLEMIASREDGLAGRLVLWILQEMPDLTQGELEEVLQTALWWSRFWACMYAADHKKQPEQAPLLGDEEALGVGAGRV